MEFLKVTKEKMMSKKGFTWSPKQLEALSLDKVNMLVSAGAGSGKTAVLTERVIRIIKDKNVPLESILVLTFTDLGAKEFRDRIKKELSKDPALAPKVYAVDNADIMTFDAYALKLLKSYGYRLNFKTDIVNIDESIEAIFIKEAFDALLLEEYENPSLAFNDIAKRFLVRDDKVLFEMVTNILKAANLTLNPPKFLRDFIDNNYTLDNFNFLVKELDHYVIYLLRNIASQVKQLSDEKHVERYNEFLEEFGTVLTFEHYMSRKEKLKKPRVPNKSFENFPEDESIGKTLKSLYDKLDRLEYLISVSNMYTIFSKEREYAKFLLDLVAKIYDIVKARKEAMNAFTFSDVARNAYALISLPDIQKELQNKYEYILVDEYQDTSDIQEDFLQQIVDNNMYMVGDIKQSIYAFRNANVYIFKDKYTNFSKGIGGRLIDLNDNYRSRSEVLTSINDILSEIMTEEYGGAKYKQEHVIGYGNKKYDENFVLGQDVGLKVINYSLDDINEALENSDGTESVKLTEGEIEAQIIIKDIQERISRGEQVYDADDKKMRPAKYKDFAILVSRKNEFPTIEKTFLDAGIPIFVDDDKTDRSDVVFIALVALLQIYVSYTKEDYPNTYEYRFAVASFLRSFVNNYSDQQLLDLMGYDNTDFSSDPLLQKIKHIAKTMQDYPAQDIIDTLVKTFDLYGAIYYLGDVAQNTMKLTGKLTQIENLAKLGLNVEEILNVMQFENADDKDISLRRPRTVDNAVTLMTIYRSKGLEFPIVYYIDLKHNYYTVERRTKFKIVAPYGISFPNVKEKPSLNSVISETKKFKEILSERIRLLYVALTRARELMVVIHDLDKEKDLNEIPFADLKNFKEILLQSPTYREHLEIIDFTPLNLQKAKEKLKPSSKNKIIINTPTYSFKETKTEVKLKEKFDVPPHILKMGTLLHRQIELYDFKTKKLDYIDNREHRDHIKKIFTLPLFVNATNENVYREYSYIDEATNETYVIDFFILGARTITLIDFKLLNIDVEEYDLQVKRYAKHLQKVFNKNVDAYLLSIINKNWRKVEVNGE